MFESTSSEDLPNRSNFHTSTALTSPFRAASIFNDPLFVSRRGEALAGDAVRKLFDRLKARAGIRDLCAHMQRHTWATNFNRSASGSKFDLMVEGGWTTGRMVERYTKARPFEERVVPHRYSAPLAIASKMKGSGP